jgi:hypothetical protein
MSLGADSDLSDGRNGPQARQKNQTKIDRDSSQASPNMLYSALCLKNQG